MLFLISPIAIVVVNSFSNDVFSTFPPKSYSLRWFYNLMQIPNFWRGAKLSLWVASSSTILTLVIATLASLALVRYKFFGQNLLRILYLSPSVIPRVAIGLAMFVFFLRLRIFGTTLSLIVSHTILIFPFALLIISATLVNVDRKLEEASMDLGASPLRTFFSVTIYQMFSGIVFATVLIFVLSFDEVETSIFLVRHDYLTLPIEMFFYMENWQDPTIAALSTLLIAVSFGLAIFVVKIGGDLFNIRGESK